ncbi:hypothetical protein F5Y16DRAFT_416330 [Xylariaceae sp. FL0255]|nr:hypothetical protein F5Y16DRAFT_416330 [Xylariaceae sp. FL0255]
MRFLLLSQALCGATLVLGRPAPSFIQNLENELGGLANGGDIGKEIESALAHVTLEESVEKFAKAPKAVTDPATYGDGPTSKSTDLSQHASNATAATTCASNPNVRFEWDNYSESDRQALMSSIKCLMNKPASGAFAHSKSRYEDVAALHQLYTPNVHSTTTQRNAKFLLWHRYFVWTFEQVLRDECGFDRAFFWWDETKHAGAFESSDIFTPAYLGSLTSNDQCVTDGHFAGLTVNIGPNAAFQTRPHGYGHSAIGGVGRDLYASPDEPWFWFHHTFVDRVYRVWELADPNDRYTQLTGTDINNVPLTMDTPIYMGGIRPDTTIGEIINTLSGSTLCYKYDY